MSAVGASLSLQHTLHSILHTFAKHGFVTATEEAVAIIQFMGCGGVTDEHSLHGQLECWAFHDAVASPEKFIKLLTDITRLEYETRNWYQGETPIVKSQITAGPIHFHFTLH